MPPCDVLGTFPRSGPEEVEEARRSLARGTRGWWKRPLDERRELVERGLARFAAAAQAACSDIASGLGLEPFELEPELVQSARAGRAAVRRMHQAPLGVALVAPDWRTPTDLLVAEVAGLLVEGRATLLTSDERAPLVPQLLVDALLDVGVPGQVVALVHAPDAEAVSVAIRSGVERVSAWGDREGIASLRRIGAGAAVPSQRLHLHRARPDRLPAGADPEDAAAEVLRRAFGRAATLSGARGGQLSTLYVPERDLSDFTGALLEALLQDRSYRDPLPFLDRNGPRLAREAWTLGLDEGATLVLGGEERGGSGKKRAVPALLTNGAAHMRVARRIEPTPVLLLCRERRVGKTIAQGEPADPA